LIRTQNWSGAPDFKNAPKLRFSTPMHSSHTFVIGSAETYRVMKIFLSRDNDEKQQLLNGIRDTPQKKGGLMAIKCPSCGGHMAFNVPTQALKCRYCDTDMQIG